MSLKKPSSLKNNQIFNVKSGLVIPWWASWLLKDIRAVNEQIIASWKIRNWVTGYKHETDLRSLLMIFAHVCFMLLPTYGGWPTKSLQNKCLTKKIDMLVSLRLTTSVFHLMRHFSLYLGISTRSRHNTNWATYDGRKNLSREHGMSGDFCFLSTFVDQKHFFNLWDIYICKRKNSDSFTVVNKGNKKVFTLPSNLVSRNLYHGWNVWCCICDFWYARKTIIIRLTPGSSSSPMQCRF